MTFRFPVDDTDKEGQAELLASNVSKDTRNELARLESQGC
jgi:hypothetical protein